MTAPMEDPYPEIQIAHQKQTIRHLQPEKRPCFLQPEAIVPGFLASNKPRRLLFKGFFKRV
jgi:hypothetical protein